MTTLATLASALSYSPVATSLGHLLRTSSTMPPKRMTANPQRPARYRPGKALDEQVSSDEDEESEVEQEEVAVTAPPRPKAASFPAETKISAELKKVDLKERRKQGEAQEAARIAAEEQKKAAEEEGFETEESEEEDGSGSEEESSEEESSSEEEAPRRQLLRPTFIKKDKRAQLDVVGTSNGLDAAAKAADEAARKKAASEQVQDQLMRDAAARAAGKKNWDDEEVADVDAVDDTDGLNPEAEYAAWKLRELKRIHRDREAIEQAEKEREEVERRRNLTKEERDAEDREYIAQQKDQQADRGKMGFMQKYYHKGAFYQDEMKDDNRDIMGSRIKDDVVNRELLPEYMQIRDMTKLGRKGRTKYKDLKTEDTGRWGVIDRPRPSNRDGFDSQDARFQPDRRDVQGPTGANASAIRPRQESGPRHSNGDDERRRKRSTSPDDRDRDKRPRVSA